MYPSGPSGGREGHSPKVTQGGNAFENPQLSGSHTFEQFTPKGSLPSENRHLRAHVVRYGRPAPDVHAPEHETSPRAAGTPGAWTWAALMRRVLDLDVLACPRCGGRLRVLATVQDPRAVQAVLAHLARSGAPAPPGPAPPAPAALL